MKISTSKIKNQQNLETYSLHNRIGDGHPSSRVKKKSIENYIGNRPASNVSFGGSAVSQAPEWANKLIKKPWFDKAVDKCGNMATIVEATLVLALVGIARPLVTLSMPAAEDKDKKMLAAKNVVSGIIGFALAFLFFKPLSAATKKILDNPAKYIKNSPELVEKLTKSKNVLDETRYLENSKFRDDYRTIFNKGADVLVSPIKSAITIGSTPFILKLMFPEKDKNGKRERINLSDILNRRNNKVEDKKTGSKGGQKR
jgi:hypothetical protein